MAKFQISGKAKCAFTAEVEADDIDDIWSMGWDKFENVDVEYFPPDDFEVDDIDPVEDDE